MENKFIEAFKEALELHGEFEVKLEDEFRSYAAWDSLSQLSLIAMMDDMYGIQLERDEFERLKTVKDLYLKITA